MRPPDPAVANNTANNTATSSDADAPTWPVVPAATLVVFRHAGRQGAGQKGAPPELLLVERAAHMRFAGGATTFPGGRIDPADHELAAKLVIANGPDPATALHDLAPRIAAIRETLEETGLALGFAGPVSAAQAAEARRICLGEGALAPVLARLGWQLAPRALVPFARWCPHWDGAFDTHFYLADLGTGAVEITVDGTENARAFWLSAAGALAAIGNGTLSALFPTRRNLERLALFASFAEARAQAEAHPVRRITPATVTRDGTAWLTIPDGLGYPVLAEPAATARRG